ncbi:NAD(P)H-quinone oxidoreductase subunit S, chloroplastic [Typha latifolia]|uniref:NAD(P)H-quinone oxidoreductase subunit S, chloroplastic n=1 Tax=Typha latifolia TaxID=4733 RepID=UPI003C2FFC37
MASSVPLRTLPNPFFSNPSSLLRKPISSSLRSTTVFPSAKFQLSELLGGRGLCNGEAGLRKELEVSPSISDPASPSSQPQQTPSPSPLSDAGDDAFEKELMGLTGGFPGGEKGLRTFIEKNPPPKKDEEAKLAFSGSKKPTPPELPLFLPGMIVIVKNPNNPFYMYCGIVQRVTDGIAGVLFEGGNWDKLITFRLDELERREKGPPMVNPKSAIIEPIVQKSP